MCSDGCLNFAELWVFNPDGQLLSIPGFNGAAQGGFAAAWGGTMAGERHFNLRRHNEESAQAACVNHAP